MAGGAIAAVALVAGVAVFGVMRGVGFEVRVQQVFWPARWHELNEARVNFFVQKAREAYAKGEIKRVLNSLASAQAIDPTNYEVGMMLAQFYQIGNPVFADTTYDRLLKDHPGRRNETAQIWFRSLLARNRLALVAQLASEQIQTDASQVWVWTNALIFSAHQLRRPELLDQTAEKIAAKEVGRVLKLAAAVERARSDSERRELLRASATGISAYELVYRIERLIESGGANDALAMLNDSGKKLSGRDTARLTLAAYEAAGDHGRVKREFSAMLAPERTVTIAEINLLALHLVRYPDAPLLENVMQATTRLPRGKFGELVETYFVMLAAAGAAQSRENFDLLATKIQTAMGVKSSAINSMRNFFFDARSSRSLDGILLEISPLSLELNYLLLANYSVGSR